MKMMGVCLPCPLVPSGQLFIVVQSLSGVQLFAIQGLQHTSLPYSSLSPRVCSNSCALSRCCNLAISSSATHFSCPQPFSVSGSFTVSGLFTSSGQSIATSLCRVWLNKPGFSKSAIWRKNEKDRRIESEIRGPTLLCLLPTHSRKVKFILGRKCEEFTYEKFGKA